MNSYVLLRNRTARPITLHLAELGCNATAVVTNERDSATGAVGRREVVRQIPKTLTLWAKGTPGDESDPLPCEVQKNSEVLAAAARRDIDVHEVTPPAAPPAETAAPADPADAPEKE